MKRLIGLVLALPMLLTAAGPAVGYQVISEVGPHGSYFLNDSMTTPGARCTYGPKVYSNWAYLKLMRVAPPRVFAADRDANKRDRRVVTWQWSLQRRNNDAATPRWRVVKSSAVQRKIAYEDAQAPFTGMTVNYDSHQEDPNHAGAYVVFRALVTIKWYKPDGSVESTVKLVPDYYRIDFYGGQNVRSDGVCHRVVTDG